MKTIRVTPKNWDKVVGKDTVIVMTSGLSKGQVVTKKNILTGNILEDAGR